MTDVTSDPTAVDHSVFRFQSERTYPGRYREDFYEEAASEVSGRVLDIGAGGGGTHDRWSFEAADEVYRIDVGDYDDLDLRADGTILPFRSKTFDTVICSAVFEHVSYGDLVALLEEVERVLQPGGAIVAAVAFNYPLHGEPHDYHRPTVYGLETLCKDTGLTTEWYYRGGSFVDTLLHVLFYPFRATLMYANLEQLSPLFALIHYPLKMIAAALAFLTGVLLGRNPLGSRWYLTNGIVARKPSE